jgi:hypothetical protein
MAGTNKTLIFGQTGGLLTYQETVAAMQAAYSDAIGYLAKAFGNYVILSGLNNVAGSYTPGEVIINGIPMSCPGGSNSFLNIDVVENITQENFVGNVAKPFYSEKTAQLVNAGGTPITSFIRIDAIANISQNLNTIQTNFNTLLNNFNSHTHSWASITGKPSWIAYVGQATINDQSSDHLYVISIPDQASQPYKVFGVVRSLSSNHAVDNDLTWAVRDLQSDQFSLTVRKLAVDTHNCIFDYIIIRL